MPQGPSLSLRFTERFILVSRAWRREADQRLAPLRLSHATAAPLMLLHDLPQGCRQAELAAALGIEQPSLVRLLDQLGAAGLLQRQEDPQDRRAKILRLTPTGQAAAARAAALLASLREELLGDAGLADLQAANRVLQAMAGRLGLHLPEPAAAPDPDAAP